MGNLATPEALRPASNRHSRLLGELAADLRRQLGGTVLTECSVLTRIGIRVPDVAWASLASLGAYGEITPYTCAPEICVEVISPSNVQAGIQEKTQAYLAAGAEEVWLVSEEGVIRYIDRMGERPASRFSVIVSLPPPSK